MDENLEITISLFAHLAYVKVNGEREEVIALEAPGYVSPVDDKLYDYCNGPEMLI